MNAQRFKQFLKFGIIFTISISLFLSIVSAAVISNGGGGGGAASCGDGVCSGGETCSSCSRDCYCPPDDDDYDPPDTPPPTCDCSVGYDCDYGTKSGDRGPATWECDGSDCCRPSCCPGISACLSDGFHVDNRIDCASSPSAGGSPGGTPGGCYGDCGAGECGVDDCGVSCGSTCEGPYLATPDCISNECQYLNASLSADVTNICINNSINRDFVVSGRSEYCGDVSITIYHGSNTLDQYVFDQNTYDNYTFGHTFNIPSSVSIPPSSDILIEIRGNRNTIKNLTYDETVYVCGQDLTLVVGYQNFYYFPEPGRTFHPDYDIYNSDDYYDFYNDGTLLDWDEKNSDITIWTCSDEPTDCVDNSAQSIDAGSLIDADADDEYELCYSENGIQGGWLDLDVDSATCALLDGQFNRETEWFNCQPSNQCFFGVDDFAPDKPGLCCGDDYGEIIHHTQSKFDTDTDYILDDGVPRTYDACCEEQGTHSCVDERGICRQEGYDYCLSSGGVKATCVVPTPGGLGEWELVIEDNCIGSCDLCDINNDGVVDITDTTAISNNFNDSTDENNPYNVNRDTVVDIHDVELCNPYIGEVCWGCGDNSLDSDEGCEYINDNYQFSCPETTCDNNVKVTRDDNSCTLLCTCEYTRSCDTSVCGGCESDNDCGQYEYCDIGNCQCEPSLCPPGTTLCQDGTCSADCDSTDGGNQGCINDNDECDLGEGCACEDCLGLQDSCMPGAICGTDELCGCAPGTTLCEDGTCSANCDDIDGDNQDCINDNGECDLGEGCACEDCDGLQDSCVAGTFCNFYTELCEYECVVTENPESTLDDGIDNDCDDLIDEPLFSDDYGVYIWESNCDYYLCANARDGFDHETLGDLSVDDYSIYNVKDIYWESNDVYQLSSDNKELSFRSLVYNGQDCLLYNADTVIKYDLDLNGSTDTANIYITQDTINPFTNPFRFANPECSLTCTDPSDCGTGIINGCSYEECIFDCGGYWNDVSHLLDPIMPGANLGDSCEDCEEDMNCLDYNNEPTCFYDPCGASLSHFGCSWNEDSEICEDALPECMPGTSLCQDGTCSADCDDTDDGNQGCINDNDECDPGEGCACEDCEGEQDSCTVGAICGEDEICGCPEGTTLCFDLTCDETCENHGGMMGCIDDPNDRCELGEGCACEDCDGFQDSCVDGTVCNYYETECVEFNYGDCPPGTTLCNDLTCDETCEDNGGKRGCIGEPNDRCESGEGCACGDCHNKRDSCERGSVCNYDYELCEERYSSGDDDDDEYCDDDDDDGYYEINEDCIGSDDCNDNDANIHPGALEICNGIDDDCDGKIDDNCIDQNYALDLSLDLTKKLRILDKFQIKVKIRNNLDKDFSNLMIMLEVPGKFKVNQRSVKIDKINALETKEIYFDGLILDYNQETALFTLKAMFPDSDIITKEIPVFIEIPEFLIAAEPRYEYSGIKCLDFYYAINQPGLYETMDIEFGVNNPKSFLGKSVLVDYVSSVQPGGNIIVRPMISNPYCLPKGSYQTKGYLYKAGPFLVETIGESTEILTIS